MRQLLASSAMANSAKSRSIGVGFTLIGSELVAFTLLGVGLDYWFGTAPGLSIAFTLAGMGAAVLHTVRLLKLEESNQSRPNS